MKLEDFMIFQAFEEHHDWHTYVEDVDVEQYGTTFKHSKIPILCDVFLKQDKSPESIVVFGIGAWKMHLVINLYDEENMYFEYDKTYFDYWPEYIKQLAINSRRGFFET